MCIRDRCVYDTEKAADYWAKGLEELGESEITLDIVVDADDAPQKVAQVLKMCIRDSASAAPLSVCTAAHTRGSGENEKDRKLPALQ